MDSIKETYEVWRESGSPQGKGVGRLGFVIVLVLLLVIVFPCLPKSDYEHEHDLGGVFPPVDLPPERV